MFPFFKKKDGPRERQSKKIRVLFVCTGNICRSPTAEGVFQRMVDQFGLSEVVEVDSAGTQDYHVGAAPDRRAQQAALKRGVDLSRLRAREVEREDLKQFDYILAMDQGHERYLRNMCPRGNEHKIKLFLEFAPHLHMLDVPDPYYGADDNFETVLDLVEVAAKGLLADIQWRHL
ncbi:MAG: low molecular weight phosphotyrosine protein phosphatase [Blastocatellia bacterium]|nr:low molecular weight phosphotyrosine protein phosphatase [Blastocatellia bacterium]